MPNSQLKAEVCKDLEKLVKNFKKNRDDYSRKSSDFDETEVRDNFIDDFFYALNWDIRNKKGEPPNRQEVRREKGPTSGEPDYTFRVPHPSGAAEPLFFVEAKSVKEGIDNPKHVFQAKSYAFSAAQSSLVLVVLTNFDRFRLYRVDEEPRIEDDVAKGMLFEWSYEEYITKIDELLIFERSAVIGGSLQSLARHGVPVKQRPPIEAPFLKRLENYRDRIAKAIFSETKKITDDVLNSATETLINRMVFIRFAEDRGIILPEDLKRVVVQWRNKRSESLLKTLNVYFDELDRSFNGRLFAHDEALSKIKIDNEILADVIEDLYPPRCPYRFNQIRVELLGDIYERHLGKIILHKGKGIRVEEKPEVRHAKGVYYTPTYIVEGILSRALKPLLTKCKKIEDIFNLRGIDPACGSGSFLLGAYRLIHDEILERAVNSTAESKLFLEIDESGSCRVNFKTKRRILEECLHGIDVDRRAVKVAELSLYLKLLEDEPDVARNPKPYLPKLEHNLQCGNSLIDTAMLPSPDLEIEDTILNRINPFTWERKEAFGAIMKNGGFDWVMGNPPYIRIQALREFSSQETDIIRENYEVVKKGNPDIYVAFIRRSLDKLKTNGTLGFIVSNKFMVTDYGAPIRNVLGQHAFVDYIVDFGDKQVFEGASTYTCILVAQKSNREGKTDVRVVDVDPAPGVLAPSVLRGVTDFKVDLRSFGDSPWEWRGSVKEEARSGFKRLDELCEIFQSIATSDDGVFVLKDPESHGQYTSGFSKALNQRVEVEKALVRTFIRGREIRRSATEATNNILIFPYEEQDPYQLISWSRLKKSFPKAAAYLEKCRSRLKARQRGNYDLSKWYGYIYAKNHAQMGLPKLMVQRIAPRATMALDLEGKYFYSSGYGIAIRNQSKNSDHQYFFLQALLQSPTVDRIVWNRAAKLRGGYIEYRKQYISDLLIPTFNPGNPLHKNIIALQKKAIEAAVQNLASKTDSQKKEWEHKVTDLENQIEEIVSSLYRTSDVQKKAA